MSLWTPSGEHRVDRPGGGGPSGQGGPGGGTPPGGAGDPGAGGGPPPGEPEPALSEEDQAARAELDELRRQLAATPAEVVVANHCYGLFELAAVYLSQSPPSLFPARLAIDALGLLVEGLGERLGEAEGPLREAVAQVRLAYVQLDAAEQARRETSNGQS